MDADVLQSISVAFGLLNDSHCFELLFFLEANPKGLARWACYVEQGSQCPGVIELINDEDEEMRAQALTVWHGANTRALS